MLYGIGIPISESDSSSDALFYENTWFRILYLTTTIPNDHCPPFIKKIQHPLQKKVFQILEENKENGERVFSIQAELPTTKDHTFPHQ